MIDHYKSISQPAKSLFKDKGSRFIGLVYPVEDEIEVKQKLYEIKKEYHDASHHCFAYRIGLSGEVWRINDDGEPSGSAGKPIYGQLLSFEVSDVLAVIVRYFGGTKLGVPGLINAYRNATKEALLSVDIIKKVLTKRINIDFTYPFMNNVMKIIKDEELKVISTDFNIDCNIIVEVRLNDHERINDRLSKIDTVRCKEDKHQHKI